MTPDEIRQIFLDFYQDREHIIVPSASLVPENDPTTLFTGSGMQPMIEYFLGTPHPLGSRIADSQRCFRSQDIEEVGDNRHSTYFEMLGNWSFGDYFKEEQLAWIFSLLTDKYDLNPARLYVSVYRGNPALDIPRDDQSAEIWQKLFATKGIEAEVVDEAEKVGLSGGRIFYYLDNNWWSRSGKPEAMPAGEPSGPDSEIFYDFGAELQIHERSTWANQPCHINCDCGRFIEIGNSVFMQYQKNEDGSFSELPKKNVDFGGGLERIAAAIANSPDVFQTGFYRPIIGKLESLSARKYGNDEGDDRSFRVIADHVRAAVMLTDDGVYPSNKEQGYFSRRLVRRAVRYAKMIGITRPFISELTAVVASIYQNSYPSIDKKLTQIQQALSDEEQKFEKTLEKGLKEIEKVSNLDGKVAFHLYETYGFPFELTEEIANERGQKLSKDEFETAKHAHAQSSRTASVGKFKGGLAGHSARATQYHTATHLLHAALRLVLGQHVQQRGSNITDERLRFDFTHPEALSDEEKKKVEEIVNGWIKQALPVSRQVMAKDEALKSGALAFFGEKYGDEVSVYTVGRDAEKDWVSKELCGGPHVENTSEILPVEIFKEKSAAAGVRRVYLRVK